MNRWIAITTMPIRPHSIFPNTYTTVSSHYLNINMNLSTANGLSLQHQQQGNGNHYRCLATKNNNKENVAVTATNTNNNTTKNDGNGNGNSNGNGNGGGGGNKNVDDKEFLNVEDIDRGLPKHNGVLLLSLFFFLMSSYAMSVCHCNIVTVIAYGMSMDWGHLWCCRCLLVDRVNRRSF
jgi:hypothetical protein